MSSSATIRFQIEAVLAHRIPSALTPAPRVIRPTASVGIPSVDALLEGGLPLGAMTEMVGPECSGRTSLVFSFLSRITHSGKVGAWVDVTDSFDPESAAAAGVDLARLLWIRCGVAPTHAQQAAPKGFVLPEKCLIPLPVKKGLHGGGFGPHPRHEVKGLSDAVSGFLQPEAMAPRCAEPQRRLRKERPDLAPQHPQVANRNRKPIVRSKPWTRMEQALKATDLLLQAGGFGAIVLDLGSISPEYASRIPLATWFRYRAAAERSQAAILLLTQHTCAKSSAGLVLRLEAGTALHAEPTVFTGAEYRIKVARERFQPTAINVVSLRKPPHSERETSWQNLAAWAGRR